MRLDAMELRRVELPLVTPFRTSFGTQTVRTALIVRAITDIGDGWGECVAEVEPLYSSEFLDAAELVIRDHLVPRLFKAGDALTSEGVAGVLAPVKGHPMAKAALEMAVLDAELRAARVSFATRLGAVRSEVDCGVSVGITPTIDALVELVGRYVDDGYRRIKLKIEPGWDIEPVAAVRAGIGSLPLQVDANTAYTVADADHLAGLDEFDLLLIEQPLPEDDLRGHAEVAKRVRTPICLDESIVSARAAIEAIELGACSIVNIKAGRVGGYLEAVRVHDVCAARGVPVWCGGMLETGLGRAANLALAALPNFTLPGDTSASARYWVHDLTDDFVLIDGRLRVPDGPGLGVAPLPDRLAEMTTSVSTLRRDPRE